MKSAHLTQLRDASSFGKLRLESPSNASLAGGSFVREFRPMLHHTRSLGGPGIHHCIRSIPDRKSLALSMTQKEWGGEALGRSFASHGRAMLHGAAHLVAVRRRSRTLSDGSHGRKSCQRADSTSAVRCRRHAPATMRCIALAARGKVPRPCVISAQRISTRYTRFSTRARRATLAGVASSRRSGGPWSTSATERSRRLRL